MNDIFGFDKETEVLTNNGWKLFKDLNIKEDMVLSRQPGAKFLDYKSIKEIICEKYSGEMFYYVTNMFDIKTTMNHKLFAFKDGGIQNKEHLYKEGFITCANIINARHQSVGFVDSGGIWEGIEGSNLYIDNETYNKRNVGAFVGLFLTNGKFLEDGSLKIECDNKRKFDWFEEIIQLSGFKFKRIEEERTSRYVANRSWIIPSEYFSFFNQFKSEWRIPKSFKNADKETLQMILEGASLAFSPKLDYSISCKSKDLYGDLMEIAYKCGYSAVGKEIKGLNDTFYSIDIYFENHPYFYNKYLRIEDYNDDIFTVVLNEWNTLLVRRNGKAVWCGTGVNFESGK